MSSLVLYCTISHQGVIDDSAVSSIAPTLVVPSGPHTMPPHSWDGGEAVHRETTRIEYMPKQQDLSTADRALGGGRTGQSILEQVNSLE